MRRQSDVDADWEALCASFVESLSTPVLEGLDIYWMEKQIRIRICAVVEERLHAAYSLRAQATVAYILNQVQDGD